MALPPRKPPSTGKTKRQRTVATIPDRYDAFMKGEITIDDMDEDEIMRSQFRGRDGTFKGRPPKFVPREFATAVMAKQHEIVATRIAGLVSQAFDTLSDVMGKPFPQPGDAARVKAAQLVLERYLGRVPEAVNIRVEKTAWESNKQRFIKTVPIGELTVQPSTTDTDGEVVEGELEDPDE